MTKKKKEKQEPIDHSQDLIKAQAELLNYLHMPQNDTEIRTFSSINTGLIYPISAIQIIRNGLKQLFRAEIFIDNISEKDWEKEVAKQKAQGIDITKGRKKISFQTDPSLVDNRNKEFVEEILKVAVSGAKRADALITMEKDKKSKKVSDGFGMFSGLINNGEASDEEDYIEDEEEEPEVKIKDQNE